MLILMILNVYLSFIFLTAASQIQENMWSCEKTTCKFTYPQNCYRFFPIIVFVGFGVQYILESIHQEDLPSRASSRRFAF